MLWNWQLPSWPKFTYDPHILAKKEKQFLLNVGSSAAFLKNTDRIGHQQFIVEILSEEGIESSRIEGEFLDRESLQSSIKKHFGIKPAHSKINKKEAGMAKLLCDVYESYNEPLSHEMLWDWHSDLFENQNHIGDIGGYRTHPEPMQIISNRYDTPKIYFEAPPSASISHEMREYVEWFNGEDDSILGRAAVAHIYFESIHPFEDGNGRIGRILVEKVLSQGATRPVLIAISKVLERRKKEYYAALESCNRSLNANYWVDFFSDVILQAQEQSMKLLYFLIEKSKMMNNLSSYLNPRQEKVLIRMFEEGLEGFKGGLSAENYISITKTSRATATRDLANLVDLGALRKTGELRHTRYYLNIEI